MPGMPAEQTHDALLDKLRASIESTDWSDFETVSSSRAADIAEAVTTLEDPRAQAEVLKNLPVDASQEVAAYLDPAVFEEIAPHLPDELLAMFLDAMAMDDAAQIVDELPDARAEALLQLIPEEDAQEVRDLLDYPENSVGRLMTSKYVRAFRTWTASEVIEHLRQVDPEVETVNTIFVTDELNHLLGVFSLRELIRAEPRQKVEEFMVSDLITAPPEMDQEEAARIVFKYDLLALPILNERGRLLGIVTVDDLADVLISESTEDVLKLAAVDAPTEPYLRQSPFDIARKRVRWLVLLFLAERLTGTVMRHYEHVLDQVVALAFFVPLLLGTGGNAGAQAATTITRALALGEVRLRHIFRVFWREGATGLITGLFIGTIGFINAVIWKSSMDLALTVALAQFLIILYATTVGSVLPLIATRLNIDPALMSAPFVTTLVDASGLVIYFLLAQRMLGIAGG